MPAKQPISIRSAPERLCLVGRLTPRKLIPSNRRRFSNAIEGSTFRGRAAAHPQTQVRRSYGHARIEEPKATMGADDHPTRRSPTMSTLQWSRRRLERGFRPRPSIIGSAWARSRVAVDGVHHAGRKVVIHWMTFEAMVLRGGDPLGQAEIDHGRLLVTFQYRGHRCREYVGLKDTRENRRAAAGIVREIELEIASGKFDYHARFPASRNLERLGLQSTSVPRRIVFCDFALGWLEELRPTVARSTAYG